MLYMITTHMFNNNNRNTTTVFTEKPTKQVSIYFKEFIKVHEQGDSLQNNITQ